jgi:hypothetical protein
VTFVTLAFFWGYVAMLVGIGVSGIFIAPWELTRVFGIPLGSLESRTRATMLNQYRFLKALELGFGAYAVVFRREIFTVAEYHRLFLFVLFAAALSRVLSMVIDGLPTAAFIVLTVLEFVTGTLILYAGPPLFL